MTDVNKGIIPFGVIPDSNTFPDDIYRLKVESLTPMLTKEREGKAQKLMFKLDAVVVEPAEFKGQHYFEQYCIGSEDDPEADELKTWQTTFGAKNFKKFIKALGIPFGDEEDRESFCNALKGGEFLATIVEKVEPATKKVNGVEEANPYAGTVRNNATAYWKLGEKEPGTGKTPGAGTTPRKTATPPKVKVTGEAKPPTTDEITCVACRKRIPRKSMLTHIETEHKAEMEGTGTEDE